MINLVRIVPQGRIGPFFNSAFPVGTVERGKQSYIEEFESFNLRDVEIQDKNELLNIVNHRFQNRFKDQPNLTAVFGDPDFLPFSFLTLGITRGAAVCRLLENFEDSVRIDELVESIENAGVSRGKPYSIIELREILSIKDPDFFQDFDDTSAYEALRIPEKIKQVMPIPAGTGFLVGKNYLLTAKHVIDSVEKLGSFIAEFNYEKDLQGAERKVIRYELDPSFYISDKKLDYALVKLKEAPLDGDLNIGEAGDYFGWITMLKDDQLIAPPLNISQVENFGVNLKDFQQLESRLKKPDLNGNLSGLPGEPVSIIQHPKGRFKEIVLSNNRVQGVADNFLYYEADADYSSSGSPVFNEQWQLVALHHAYISERTFEDGQETLKILGYEGTRVFRIIENLEAQANNSLEGNLKEEVSNFINKFVDLNFEKQVSDTIGRAYKIEPLLD